MQLNKEIMLLAAQEIKKLLSKIVLDPKTGVKFDKITVSKQPDDDVVEFAISFDRFGSKISDIPIWVFDKLDFKLSEQFGTEILTYYCQKTNTFNFTIDAEEMSTFIKVSPVYDGLSVELEVHPKPVTVTPTPEPERGFMDDDEDDYEDCGEPDCRFCGNCEDSWGDDA